MRGLVVVVLALFSACAKSSSVQCGNELCPEGTFCDTPHSLCVNEPQTLVCVGMPDGDVCTAGDVTGICDQQFCIPGCGDTVQSANEECDDGNHISRDGCSSGCLLETLSWSQWQDPYKGLAGGIAGYHAQAQKLISFGGFDETETRATQWERDARRNWVPRSPSGLPPRDHAAMAYDPVRNVLVAFGGRAPDGTALGETWENNGTGWTQKVIAGPPARFAAAMTFETVNNQIMLFGGTDPNNPFSGMRDVWRYNGSAWTSVAHLNTTVPALRWLHAMTWDPVNAVVVVAGGMAMLGASAGKAYTYNPATNTWVDIGAPWQNRHSAALAYYPWHGRVVMFGGSTTNINMGDTANVANDTWELNVATLTWTAITTAGAPPGREFHTLTYVPYGTGGNPDTPLVLLGGRDATTFFDDVWEYTSHNQQVRRWDRRRVDTSPAAGPFSIAFTPTGHALVLAASPSNGAVQLSADRTSDTWTFDGAQWSRSLTPARDYREYYALGYDAARNKTLVFGGANVDGAFLREMSTTTSEWDGVGWTDFPGQPIGLQRFGGSLAQAGPTGGMLLFGGTFDFGNAPTLLEDTWLWSGSAWQQITSPAHPGPHARLAMAYDPSSERVIAFDKTAGTWAFAAGAWTQLAPIASPPARDFGAMTYNRHLRGVVLYGGSNETDLWVFNGETWRQLAIVGDGPPARQTTSITYQPGTHTLVLFGGTYANATPAGDTWTLHYESATPDENCTNVIDDDGDRLADADDPDCN